MPFYSVQPGSGPRHHSADGARAKTDVNKAPPPQNELHDVGKLVQKLSRDRDVVTSNVVAVLDLLAGA